ncbi:MAG: type I-C CRISPR-associated protein Cas8c/Csd1, partial [Gemmatimonadetes bacterium]|nr:type I-C CRISPR-associated protein Cas8c/Csd1 [Gemmatimonadota bacterium]
MILQALADYYQRKAAADPSSIAPPGFEKKDIPFLIVLGRDGEFVDLEDTREGEGKKKKGRSFAVPQSVERTVAVKANLLWDNPGYVFGWDARGNPDRALEQFTTFLNAVESLSETT